MGPVFPSSPGKFVEEFGVSPREGLTRLGAVKENALGLDTEEIVSVPEEAVGIAGLVGDHFGPVCHSVLVRIEENLDVAGTVALMARAKQVSPASSHLLDQLPEADRKSMAEAMVRSTQGWNNEAIRFAEKHLSPNEIPSLLGTLRGVWKKEPGSGRTWSDSCPGMVTIWTASSRRTSPVPLPAKSISPPSPGR